MGKDGLPSWQMVTAIIDVLGRLDEEVHDQARSNEERERIDKLVNHRVRDVRVPRPDVTLGEDGPEVRSPGVTSPSENLEDKSPVGFHGGEKFGLLADLDVSVPTMGNHPSGEELVVA